MCIRDRLRRMNNCPVKDDKVMAKQERPTYDYFFDEQNKVFAVTWKDNISVKDMSNNEGLHPMQKVSRWSKNEKKSVKIDQPYCISTYNKSMGGIDKMD